jgi:hypothetical protein
MAGAEYHKLRARDLTKALEIYNEKGDDYRRRYPAARFVWMPSCDINPGPVLVVIAEKYLIYIDDGTTVTEVKGRCQRRSYIYTRILDF